MQNEITELRNQVRTLKRIVYGFGCLLVAGIVVGATSLQSNPTFPLVKAERIQIVNSEGNRVVDIGFQDSDGTGGVKTFNNEGEEVFSTLAETKNQQTISDVIQAKAFHVVNDEGKRVASLTQSNDGGALVISNNEGLLASITSSKGVGNISTWNSKDNERVVDLSSLVDGSGSIEILKKGQKLVQIRATDSGCGAVLTFNEKGQTLVKLTSNEVGDGVVATENGKGQVLVELGATTDGEGIIQTNSSNGKPLVILSTTSNGGVVQTQNGRGKVTSTTP